MGGKKSKGNHKESSGLRKVRRIGRAIKRLDMKINRWKRYQKEIEAGEREGKKQRWNTDGLEKHKTLLQSFV